MPNIREFTYILQCYAYNIFNNNYKGKGGSEIRRKKVRGK